MNENQRLGRLGEKIAEEYHLEKGYSSLARNWRSEYGEIDLILMKGMVLVFVEVKTRRGTSMGWPEDAVTIKKQEHLIQSSEAFIDKHPQYAERPWQIDVISILVKSLAEPSYEIRHFENAVVGE
jgi:putative endonuclease